MTRFFIKIKNNWLIHFRAKSKL